MSTELKGLIEAAVTRPLNDEEARRAFTILFEGNATPSQIGGFLMVLRTRGETVNEYAAAAQVMRDKCAAVRAPEGAIDIVGTGGTGLKTLQISTATAFTVAGAGVVVAKHGNRKLSSNSGAADALAVSGIEVMVGPAVVEKALSELGIGFMMAPMHHPAMKHVMPSRIELGTRTIFNILGPLTNPAGAKRQLTGTFAPDLVRPMAEVLAKLGSEKAWIVHGSDGSDELTVTGASKVAKLENGTIEEVELHPEMAGLPVSPFEEITGGTPEENAAALRAVLSGAQGAYRDAVLFNAAGALMVADKVSDLTDGVKLAAEAIASGAPLEKLDGLARLTSSA